MRFRNFALTIILYEAVAFSACHDASDEETPPPPAPLLRDPVHLYNTRTRAHTAPVPLSDELVRPMLSDAPEPQPLSEPSPGKGVIFGRVLNAATGHGVAGVRVRVEGTELSTLSDINGQYQFADLTPGLYAFYVDSQVATCYQHTKKSAIAMAERQVELNLALGNAQGFIVRVLGINFDPMVDGERLHAHEGWISPRAATEAFMEEVSLCSGGFLQYVLEDWIDVDAIPVKADGFQYNVHSYLNMLNDESNHHEPDLADYEKIIRDFNLAEAINSDSVDEVFLWGGPWFGFYESVMIGPDAFWINGGLPDSFSDGIERKVALMGFNYGYPSRSMDWEIAVMMHSLGHRSESTLARVFGSWNSQPQHAWDRFASYQRFSPDNTGCGNIHFPANVSHGNDYDYSNTLNTISSCETFSDWQEEGAGSLSINAERWNYSQRGYMRWWFSHLPRQNGEHDGKLRNWWRYVFDLNDCFSADQPNDLFASYCNERVP